MNRRMIAALTVFGFFYATEPVEAKLQVMIVPDKIKCGPITVGVYAGKHHKGPRKVRVLILDSRRVHYDRRIKAVNGKAVQRRVKVPCRRTYVVNYLFPHGGVAAYKVRVVRPKPDAA